MQQRYYDPAIGRFLSVDPVQANANTGASFNRYVYASNNPYRFTDPDGRMDRELHDHRREQYVAKEEHLAYLRVYGSGAIEAVYPEANFVAPLRVLSGADRAATRVIRIVERGPKGTSGGERSGRDFTRAGKIEVKSSNAAKNGGQTKCDNCGQGTIPGQQSRAGVTPPKNETHVDHIIPKSKGGDGSPSNGQVLCRECNLRKGDKL